MDVVRKNIVELRCSFLGQYHAKYQRNNKRCGFKNLRCFPYCGPNGLHHEQGFCGAPITADVALVGNNLMNVEKLRAWGEFALRDGEPRFPIGSIFSLSEITPLLRSDSERSNPLFESTDDEECCSRSFSFSRSRSRLSVGSQTTDVSRRRFAFHSNKMGYHYGWVGNKHSTNQEHSFCVYVALEVAPSKFQCVGVFHSPAFTIFCRRRHKTVSKEEKDQLAEPVGEYVVVHEVGADGRIITSSSSSHQDAVSSLKRSLVPTSAADCDAGEESQNRKRLCSDNEPSSEVVIKQSDAMVVTSEENDDKNLFLSISSCNSSESSSFDFTWLISSMNHETDHATAKLRTLFLSNQTFAQDIETTVAGRNFKKFLELVKKRSTKLVRKHKLSVTQTRAIALEGEQMRQCFYDLCDKYDSQHSDPPETCVSCSVSPASSYSSDFGSLDEPNHPTLLPFDNLFPDELAPLLTDNMTAPNLTADDFELLFAF